jgi:hypothetical protein
MKVKILLINIDQNHSKSNLRHLYSCEEDLEKNVSWDKLLENYFNVFQQLSLKTRKYEQMSSENT